MQKALAVNNPTDGWATTRVAPTGVDNGLDARAGVVPTQTARPVGAGLVPARPPMSAHTENGVETGGDIRTGSATRSRRSLRMKGYDYAQNGAYFLTICIQDRACLLGEIGTDGDMQLNDAGQMVVAQWEAMGDRFEAVELDTFVIMPNHMHAIIFIRNPDPPPVGAGLVPARPCTPAAGGRATTRVAPTVAENESSWKPTDNDNGGAVGAGLVPAQMPPTLGDVVGAFKSLTTVEYTRGVKESGWPTFRGRLWQRNYYEHVVRNEQSLARIRRYIHDNPARWAFDRENPFVVRKS